MKNRLLFALALCLATAISAQATIHTVQVANFQFTPNILSMQLGDTIMWQWSNGSHTTTSTSVPTGAATWDSPMNNGSTTFTYVPTVAGTYNYHCTPHAPDMAGTFTVTGSATGVSNVSSGDAFHAFPNPVQSVLHIALKAASELSLSDATGRMVYTGTDAGSTDVNVAAMPNGIYFLRVRTGAATSTQQITVAH